MLDELINTTKEEERRRELTCVSYDNFISLVAEMVHVPIMTNVEPRRLPNYVQTVQLMSPLKTPNELV